jgi:hypothetical protein
MSFNSDFDGTPQVSSLQAASRFDHLFDAYGLGLQKCADLESRKITLIARSPASPPAQALAVNLARFQPLSIDVRIIFTQIAPSAALNSIAKTLSTACRQAPEELIRWAKNRALLEAHERLTLGCALCWTGDSMRRSEDSRSAIDRVDEGTSAIIAEANASFEKLWDVSKPLPKTVFLRGGLPGAAPTLREAALVETLSTDLNVVRIESYQRIRRH